MLYQVCLLHSYNIPLLVDRRGIEPRPEACKATVLPLSLSAHIKAHLNSPSALVAISLLPGGSVCALIWCPRGDSNPHAFRHWFLRPACLPFHHRGINYCLMLTDYNHYRKFSEIAEVFSLQRTTFLFMNLV